MTRLGLHLTKEDGQALDELATRLGLSRQQLARAAIKTYLAQYASTLTRETAK